MFTGVLQQIKDESYSTLWVKWISMTYILTDLYVVFLWCYLFIKAQCLNEMNGLDAASFIFFVCLWTNEIVEDHSSVKVFALNLCNK